MPISLLIVRKRRFNSLHLFVSSLFVPNRFAPTHINDGNLAPQDTPTPKTREATYHKTIFINKSIGLVMTSLLLVKARPRTKRPALRQQKTIETGGKGGLRIAMGTVTFSKKDAEFGEVE